MIKSYREALLDPNISWTQLTQGITLPDRLYKYQFFYSEEGEENKYWKNNIQGEFHLSLGCEFEDTNDCRPYINKMDVKQYLNNFLSSMKAEQSSVTLALKQFDEAFDDNTVMGIVQNYQNMIRIGCFTDSFQNEKMWRKYSNRGRGFCIEYDTKKSELFSLSMLPVVYTSEQYNMSMNYAKFLILECCLRGKKRSREEQLRIYGDIYEKLLKIAYIPLFLKNAEKWSFEREYRLFIIKNRNTENGMLCMENMLNDNYNIDLSRAIKAIYLGVDFDKNKNAEKLYDAIMDIRKKKQGDLFDIYRMNEDGIAQKQI